MAKFDGPHTVVVESESTTRQLSAANILIAVGTAPSRLDRDPAEADIQVNSDEILQIKQLPRNVTFRFGEGVQQLRVVPGPPRHTVLTLESGKRIVSDLVLFTVGRTGATNDLNLESAGLTADDRQRLKVDALDAQNKLSQ